MSNFRRPIRVELTDLSARKKPGVVVLEPLSWQMVYGDDSSTITVPAGRVSDGPSVPLIAQPLVGSVMSPKMMRGGLIHDELYGTHATDQGVIVTRAQADAVFRDALIVSGVRKWRAWACWLAVRVFGHRPYEKRNAAGPDSLRDLTEQGAM